jgi:carbonic anhydrase/acetyltransferase-like protein (isoleucine patch superfamily)
MVMGAPAKVKREVSADDLDLICRSAQSYIMLKNDDLAAVPKG